MTTQQAPSPAGTMMPARDQYEALCNAIEYLEHTVLVPQGLGLPTFIPAFATASKPQARVWCHWGSDKAALEQYKGLRAKRGFAWRLESGQEVGTLNIAPRHLSQARLDDGSAYMDILIGLIMIADLAESKGDVKDGRRTHTGYLDTGVVQAIQKCGISASFQTKAGVMGTGWIHTGTFKPLAGGPFQVAFSAMPEESRLPVSGVKVGEDKEKVPRGGKTVSVTLARFNVAKGVDGKPVQVESGEGSVTFKVDSRAKYYIIRSIMAGIEGYVVLGLEGKEPVPDENVAVLDGAGNAPVPEGVQTAQSMADVVPGEPSKGRITARGKTKVHRAA